MGYSYDDRGRLCCDSCGVSGGVQKRKCPYTVTNEHGKKLPYCTPPALCTLCYQKIGGLRILHGSDCREGAERSQRECDERRAKLDAGELMVQSAWGSWYETVPEGKVGLIFKGREGQAVFYLVPAEQYKNQGGWLSDFTDVTPWEDHPGSKAMQFR